MGEIVNQYSKYHNDILASIEKLKENNIKVSEIVEYIDHAYLQTTNQEEKLGHVEAAKVYLVDGLTTLVNQIGTLSESVYDRISAQETEIGDLSNHMDLIKIQLKSFKTSVANKQLSDQLVQTYQTIDDNYTNNHEDINSTRTSRILEAHELPTFQREPLPKRSIAARVADYEALGVSTGADEFGQASGSGGEGVARNGVESPSNLRRTSFASESSLIPSSVSSIAESDGSSRSSRKQPPIGFSPRNK